MTDDRKNESLRIRGFGYLYRRGSVWWIRYSVRNRDFRESSGSEKDTDAIKLLKRRWQEVGRGRFIGPAEEKVTADDLFDCLERDYLLNRRRSVSALNSRLKHLREAFSGMRAIDITESEIEKYKLNRLHEKTERRGGIAQPATINRELAMLRKAFNLVVRQKRLRDAPAITMMEESSPRQGFIESNALESIVKNLPDYLKDFARFGYFTGWRKATDVDRHAAVILLRSEHSKNKEPRLLPLAGSLGPLIERRWNARAFKRSDGSTAISRFVFHLDGEPVGDFRKAWTTAVTRADLPGIIFHDLRRSAVRNMDRSGVGQAVAMKITGHKTDSVYRRYRIVSEADLAEALEKTHGEPKGKKAGKVTVIAKKKR